MLPLAEEHGRILLSVARQALAEAVAGRALPDPAEFSGALIERAGAFVTLRIRGSLRGCIGQVEAERPLVHTVAACAAAAALEDPRFPPVRPAELGSLDIEVSILSPPTDINPTEIEVGRHGLLISSGFQRGLLLPQVAVEWRWDSLRFLEETCRKAGLPRDAWQRGARVQGFTTQVFIERCELKVR
jgi:AmmeMemoRadiSam system protein A